MVDNLWNEEEAAGFAGDLALRVYTSRLLGRNPDLVLHGGGNTSVKVPVPNLYGEEEEILYVKGSGWDLGTIEAAGFAPVRLAAARRLATLERLTDLAMVNELRSAMILPSAPTPSVEAILHAVLPFRFVDHTHADAVVTVTNTPDGARRIAEIYGEQGPSGGEVVVIPYVMPGFELARYAAERFAAEAGPRTVGMILLNHGVFSWGETAKEAYDRMIDLVGKAEAYLQASQAWSLGPFPPPPSAPAAPGMAPDPAAIAQLRSNLSKAAGAPMILASRRTPRTLAFCQRPDLDAISQRGPATPDHVIRTKRLPLAGRDVAAYVRRYDEAFDAYGREVGGERTRIDPAPRVVLDPELGLLTAGRTVAGTVIAGEIYEHTMDVIERAERLGGFRALSAREIFDIEYWDLEQAKLRKGGVPPVFTGEVALVTGAASGIGRACVVALLARGAAVVGLDVDLDGGKASEDSQNDGGNTSEDLQVAAKKGTYLGIRCDVTDEAALRSALGRAVDAFGGVDMLVLNAGIFPAGSRIGELGLEEWHRVQRVNLDANVTLLRLAYPLLRLAPGGGRVVGVGSRNVPAPGPGAAAYSASKAALVQLLRVAALEWGAEGIRVNGVHPNAVFDTGIWTDEVLAARAAAYGMTVEAYKTNNVLRAEVRSRDVAEVVAELLGPRFARTTGAWVPVDGGNERVI